MDPLQEKIVRIENPLYRAILEIIKRYLEVESHPVFLFGSEAEGTASPGSDIDVGIGGNLPIPGNIMEKIRGDLESLPTLRKIDLVDFSLTSDSFKTVASQKIIPLTE